MSFWARYVLLKEQQGVPREDTLDMIEVKYGIEKRKEIEKELGMTETPL